MADLWSLLDDTLAAQAMARLGAGGDYTTLLLQEVIIDSVWNLDRNRKYELIPFGVVLSSGATEEAGYHGDGFIHADLNYEYVCIAVAESEGKQAARRDAKELRRRWVVFLRTLSVQQAIHGEVGDDGERVQRVNFRDSGFDIFGRADRDSGTYLALGFVRFSIDTSV